MADFHQLRNDLREGRENHEKLRLEFSGETHALRMLEKELEELQRQKSDNNELYLRRRQQLEGKIAAAKRVVARKNEQMSGIKDRLSEIEKNFELFVDPRRELETHFSNQTPFLLFPLRIETRFKTIDNKSQLWVRVYPDECMVDSFEPLLSKKEVNNAARFWAEYYSAGKPADPSNPEPAVLELQKSAWRLIVSAHGSGRSAWITSQLIPDEVASIFPVRGPKTVILAIVAADWNPTDQLVIFDLFKELWFANGNDKLIQQIKADFNAVNISLDADNIIETYQPVNFDEKLPNGLKRSEADLQFALVFFPDLEKKSGKEHSWSQPSLVNLLPERLALIRFKNNIAMPPIFGRPIPSPLPTSPDPSPDAKEQFKQTTQGDLEFEESIRWVADFNRAVEIGMGFRLDLEVDELNGFSRLFVLGVRIGADAEEGKRQLEALFNHHYFSKKGFSIVPQGTATNNTGSSDSGFTHSDNADETFEQYFRGNDGFKHTGDETLKRDGQWLAEWLGLDEKTFSKVLHSGGRDQSDAKNMNIALWPATWGYALESMMQFLFSPETLGRARSFFNSYVSGRGPLPAIRIGNQPYGILPTTAFGRLEWMNLEAHGDFLFQPDHGTFKFLKDLYQLLVRIENSWNHQFRESVAHVAQTSTEVYKTLLEVLHLHPTSVEFHRRYLESLIEISNAASMIKPGFYEHKEVVDKAMDLLRNTLGYQNAPVPQIAALLAHTLEHPVANLIDDVPISETLEIGKYTADEKNYLTALIRQARKSENAVRIGEGLTKRPVTELYRLLKYALELGYHTSAVDLAESKGIFSETKLASLRVEQLFAHQEYKGEVTESRYALLYQTVPALSTTHTVSELIHDSLFEPVIPPFSQYLSSQLKAVEQLEGASTARLERAFVEHLDCCSYRLDAWKTGIITNELNYMRGNFHGADDQQSRTGIFLGAFGWLENVRPNKRKVVSEKEVPGDLVEDFNPDKNKTFLTDSLNEGYIHTPSLNQAVTAAVLRNGFISHGKPDGNNVLAVNLSSERIRLALSVIEGIQGGQSLAALLGYHFERSLHDRKDLTSKGIDAYIYAIRKQFPLVADKLKDTKVKNNTDSSVDPETIPITAVEARNVVHGVNLVNHVKGQIGSGKSYPFGLTVINNDADIGKAITEAVNEMMDIGDAVADLGIAESVHHVVMGNYDRAAGVLEAYSKGNYPQEPDVIRTPRSGATLTHRVAIPLTYISHTITGGPRARCEPSMNKWLSTILPSLSKIVCRCNYISRADGLPKSIEISLHDLGLEPLDLLYILRTLDSRSINELDDRFLHHLHTVKDPRLDGNITLNYTEESSDSTKFSVFQVTPLVKSLRALLIESQALTPTDITLPNEASKKDMSPPELNAQRLEDLKISLSNVVTNAKGAGGIIGYLNSLPVFETATETELKLIRDAVDTTIGLFADFLLELGNYGIPQTGIGSLYTQQKQWFVALKNKLQEVSDRWQKKSDDYAVLGSQPITMEILQEMERLISPDVTPAASISKLIVDNKNSLFQSEFTKLKGTLTKKQAILADLLTDIKSLNTTDFDILPFDVDEILRSIPVFVYDLQGRSKTLLDDLEVKRIPAVNTIQGSLATLSLSDKAKQIEAAARIILGDDFKMVPRYAMPAQQQTEISNAWNATDDLLKYLKAADDGTSSAGKGLMNPTEDWLHGMARVHEKMKHLENCILFRNAFDMIEDDLTIHPVQLPFKTEKYHWLAMPFKEEDVNMEKTNALLYTAFTAQSSNAPAEVCGMLVDEWTELIPAKEETTGIAFQYDRPNSEAPQTMLLVTPTKLSGNWTWNDLVDALTYTFDAARSRAIEPGQIDTTAFASFLPAVLGAESISPFSLVLDNKVHYMAEEYVRNFER